MSDAAAALAKTIAKTVDTASKRSTIRALWIAVHVVERAPSGREVEALRDLLAMAKGETLAPERIGEAIMRFLPDSVLLGEVP